MAFTILLVDDDTQIRELVRSTLQAQGYCVLEACDARGALTISSEWQGSIHLLLSDIVMPGMSGTDLAVRLGALRPGLRVLLMSGDERATMQVQAQWTFIQKPFGLAALILTVEELLQRSPKVPPKVLKKAPRREGLPAIQKRISR